MDYILERSELRLISSRINNDKGGDIIGRTEMLEFLKNVQKIKDASEREALFDKFQKNEENKTFGLKELENYLYSAEFNAFKRVITTYLLLSSL